MSCKKIIVKKEVIDFEEFLQGGRGKNRKRLKTTALLQQLQPYPVNIYQPNQAKLPNRNA